MKATRRNPNMHGEKQENMKMKHAHAPVLKRNARTHTRTHARTQARTHARARTHTTVLQRAASMASEDDGDGEHAFRCSM